MSSAAITGVQTPERSPEKRPMGITQAQKQALVDNLQLEITERARKLRAQYALQAQGLRARLEMRVNRIPSALRKRNIQDLMDEHIAKSKPAQPPPVPVVQKQPVTQARNVNKQPLKRKSEEISTEDDKENVPDDDLPNPKKRTKTAIAVANSKATRTASRKVGPAGVLSPKSHNSRTYPQSPLKQSGLSPEKTQLTRPVTSTQTASTRPVTRAPSRQAKRADPPSESRTSEASNSSAGTTIVTKPGTRKAAVPKKTAPAKAVGGVRKTTAVRADAAPPAAATRTLRKRN